MERAVMRTLNAFQSRRRGRSASRGLVPMSAIRRLTNQIVDQFRPERVVLFGSYAYGRPTRESDVDLLVVMHASNETNQAVRIRLAVNHPFPLDLIVRTPQNLRSRLAWGDWFLREVTSHGKVLYAKADGRVGPEGRGRRGRRTAAVPTKAAPQ